MANEPVNPHDAFFKQYLSHPPVAADFLRHQLSAPVVDLLDLGQLQLAKDSLVGHLDEILALAAEVMRQPTGMQMGWRYCVI